MMGTICDAVWPLYMHFCFMSDLSNEKNRSPKVSSKFTFYAVFVKTKVINHIRTI